MSALHRLKAYFGMVPMDELDDYGADYHDEYRRDEYRSGYDRPYRAGTPEVGAHDAGVRETDPYETDRPGLGRDRPYPAGRRPSRADLDGYPEDYPKVEPNAMAAPRLHTARRPNWASPPTPVHGSLAVDSTPPVREPLAAREPLTPPRTGLFADEEAHPLARIVTLHPHNYSEARPIGERYREGAPVIMNLTGMDDKDAKRLVDFAAGLAFALRGSIDKVTNKVFLLSPPNVDVSAEDRRRIVEGGLFNQP